MKVSKINPLLDAHVNEARRLTFAGYTLIGKGSNRTVFLNPQQTHVIKVAHDGAGILENINEARVWSEAPIGERYRLARCKLIRNNILIMEAVREPHYSIRPIIRARQLWAEKYNFQVGYNKNGRLVAFDYG